MGQYSKDYLMIFEKPELYFFPYYHDCVLSPYGVTPFSLPYYCYRAMDILNLPGRHIFWGDWKKHIQSVNKVIIFDYGYQKGMERYIQKCNPNCKVFLFCWNKIDRTHNNYRLFSNPSAVYSTDKRDCEQYGFHFTPIFYPAQWYQPYCAEHKQKLFFVGQDKGRAPFLAALKQVLEEAGLHCDIRVVTKEQDPAYLEQIKSVRAERGLTYQEYLQEISKSGILLDINQEGQTAPTMRVMEAMFLSKKLITNNEDLVHYDFYNPKNIFIIGSRIEDFSALRNFLEQDYEEVPEEIRNRYSMEHWLDSFV